MIYCIDTSALIAAWQERYPIENFPRLWERIDVLIERGRLVAPDEVLRETTKRSDELHAWLKARASMFLELNIEIQIEAAQILTRFPRLVGERKMRTSADPFVIAASKVNNFQLVTEEARTGSDRRPNIPDVCSAMHMTTITLLQMIRAEKWIVG